MHRQLAASQLFQPLADLVAVHRATRALEQPENHQRASAGVQLFLEFAILRSGVQFGSSHGQVLTSVIY
jgi:hypothetical protein